MAENHTISDIKTVMTSKSLICQLAISLKMDRKYL